MTPPRQTNNSISEHQQNVTISKEEYETLKQKAKCAYDFLILVVCNNCKKLKNRGYCCNHCGDCN